VKALAAFLVAAVLGFAPAAQARDQKEEPEDFSAIKLGAGLSAGFGLLHVGRTGTTTPVGLRGHVLSGGGNFVVRALVDESSGASFGYRLELVPLSTTVLAGLRVDIHPLDAAAEKQLVREARCKDCAAPFLLSSSAVRFPPPQVVREGDTLVIDLLTTPKKLLLVRIH
jgi:hypothetical protein